MQLYRQFNRLFIGKMLLSGSNFAILLLLSNFYPSRLTGEYYFQVTLVSTIAVFLTFGTDNSLFFFVKKNVLPVAGLLGMAVRMLYFFFTASALILLLYYIGMVRDPLYLVFTAAFIFSLLVQHIFNAVFFHKGKGWKLQAFNICVNLIYITFLVIGIHSTEVKNFQVLVFSYYGLYFSLTMALLLSLCLENKTNSIRSPSFKTIKQVFKFGAMPYISNSIFFLGANMDLFFIKLFSNSSLTVYIQAIKIFQVICSVSYLLYFPFMGQMINASRHQGMDILLRTGRIMTTCILLFLAPFYVLCYFFLGKFFPTATGTIFNLLLLLGVAVIATSVAYLYTGYFVATKKYRQNMWSAVLFLVTVVLLCLVLVPSFGVYGGAIAYSVAILFSLLFDIFCIVRLADVKFTKAVFLNKEDIKLIKGFYYKNAV